MVRPDRLFFTRTSLWRWRLRAPNGRIIGCSSESYVRRSAMLANAARLLGRGAIAGDIHLADQTLEWEWRQALQARYGTDYADTYGETP